MSQENTITLRGFVTAEPNFWQTTPTQTPVTEIRVGSTPRRLNRATGEWEDGDTSYYNVKCWRRLAVNVRSSLHKGDMVIIRGKFFTRTWVDDQQRTRTQLQVEADSVGHDLGYGWSIFQRGANMSWNTVRAQADGEMARQDLEADPDGLGDSGDTDEAEALPDPAMTDSELANPESADRETADPLTADPGVPDPAMSDADFDALSASLDARAEIAPTF
jgi:single-strand DNA-binding protein